MWQAFEHLRGKIQIRARRGVPVAFVSDEIMCFRKTEMGTFHGKNCSNRIICPVESIDLLASTDEMRRSRAGNHAEE